MRKFPLVLAFFFLGPAFVFSAEPLTVTRVIEGDTLELSDGESVRLLGIDTPESFNNSKLWGDAKSTGLDAQAITKMGKEAAEFTRKLVMADQASAKSSAVEAKSLSDIPVVPGAAYNPALITALPGSPEVNGYQGLPTSVAGKQVRVEYDVQKTDKFGRTLAYLYILTDMPKGTFYGRRGKDDFDYYVDGEKNLEIFVNATLVAAGYAQVLTVPPNVKYQELFRKIEKEARDQKRGLWGRAVKADPKKLGYNFGIVDATGHGEVRASNAKIGVDYKVFKNSTVGVEASRGLHDSQDASAWGRSVEDENAAQAKYKVSF